MMLMIDEYKTIQDFKKELIAKNILHKDGDKKIDNIVNKWKQTKDKEIVYINIKIKLVLDILIYMKFLKSI